jgi:protease I
MPELDGKKILLFAGDIYEDLELLYPKIRLTEAGAETTVAAEKAGVTYTGKHGYPIKSDAAFDAILNPTDYDALVIPGGFMPDKVRRSEKALAIVRKMYEAEKTIAFICHGGWIPISAGIVKGHKTTSTPAIKDDLRNAGAEWVDEEVVVDGVMITSRNPNDLPAFCRAIIKELQAK